MEGREPKRGRTVEGWRKIGMGDEGLDLLGEAGGVGLGGGHGGPYGESVKRLHSAVAICRPRKWLEMVESAETREGADIERRDEVPAPYL